MALRRRGDSAFRASGSATTAIVAVMGGSTVCRVGERFLEILEISSKSEALSQNLLLFEK